jgi:alkylated DNA repair protein alkB family protein 1
MCSHLLELALTFGVLADWTNRTYRDTDRVGVPAELLKYAAAASAAAGWRSAVRAEAVIVNYYTLASTLGGHLDDVEPDQESPIVSLSLGCAAVFLVGGCTKEEAPTAVFLRSGDALLMSGESRR